MKAECPFCKRTLDVDITSQTPRWPRHSRNNPGRMRAAEFTRAYSVMLNLHDAEVLRALGEGNRSRGVRKALDMLIDAKLLPHAATASVSSWVGEPPVVQESQPAKPWTAAREHWITSGAPSTDNAPATTHAPPEFPGSTFWKT